MKIETEETKRDAANERKRAKEKRRERKESRRESCVLRLRKKHEGVLGRGRM